MNRSPLRSILPQTCEKGGPYNLQYQPIGDTRGQSDKQKGESMSSAAEIMGREAKDVITNFRGVVTGYTSYITGFDQVLLQPECDNGKHVEPHWFDVNRVEVVGSKRIAIDTDVDKGACEEAPKK